MSGKNVILSICVCLVCGCANNNSGSGTHSDKKISNTNMAEPIAVDTPVVAKKTNIQPSAGANGEKELYTVNNNDHIKYTGKTPGQFPEGSEKKLAEKDVIYLSEWGLKIMLSEIYARHGQTFSRDPQLEAHFRREKWYHPVSANVNKKLTKLEKQNIAFLKNYKYKSGLTYQQ
jgi:hypothetical protein